MEFKGTKGKWEIIGEPFIDEEGKYGYHGWFDIKSGETTAAIVNAYNFFNIEFEEAKANALLISKAPEMLEMLKKVLDVNEHHGFDGHSINKQIEKIIREATEL